MPVRKYTHERLLALRDSPLVQAPPNLPAIEQWIDESQQQSQTQRTEGSSARRQHQQQRPNTGSEASPMGNFSTGQRPGLAQMRSQASRSGDDISLGPPKTMFPSSSRITRPLDFTDRTNETQAAEEGEPGRSSRFFGDKQANRKSLPANESEGRHNRESWTQVRERRGMGGDDETGERHTKFGRRDRDPDERRNGFSEKTDGRWGAHKDDKRQNGESRGGWRDRERQKNPEWDSRDSRPSKEPEWFLEPKQEEETGAGDPKNTEDFEKWKKAQHARNKKSVDEEPFEPPETAAPVILEPAPAKKIVPLKLDSLAADKAFGGWGENRRADPLTESAPTPAAHAPPPKGKSRFMPMFKKDEQKEQAPVAEVNVQNLFPDRVNGPEDQAGFERMMNMLRATGVNVSQTTTPMEPISPPPPQSRMASNGQKPKSRFTGFFDQTPKSPERMQSPPASTLVPFPPVESEIFGSGKGANQESGSNFGGRLPDNYTHERPVTNLHQGQPISPAPPANGGREQQSSSRMNDLFIDAPSRGASTPDNNIQNLLAQRNRQGQDKNSEFLLGLLTAKGTSRPPSQQARPDSNFPIWLDQSANMPEPHAPKPMVQAKPGLFEDQLLRNAPPDLLRHEQQHMPSQDMPQRRTSQRAPPPGFFDEQSLFMQQQQQAAQRRAFTEAPQQHIQQQQQPGRRPSGHPVPGLQMQMPPPGQQFSPPDFIQSPGGLHQQAPPPGFNPHMRHLPGFHNIPDIFQARQPQQREMSAGFGGSAMMQQPGLSPNAPPGFFGGPSGVPPGFMQMRQPTDGIPGGLPSMRGNVNARGVPAYDNFDLPGQRRP